MMSLVVYEMRTDRYVLMHQRLFVPLPKIITHRVQLLDNLDKQCAS